MRRTHRLFFRRRLRDRRQRHQRPRRRRDARPQGPQGRPARAQRPHRRLPPHRGGDGAGLRPRRDGDHLRALHHLAAYAASARTSRPVASRSAIPRRRPACSCPTAAMPCSPWTAPATSPPSRRWRSATVRPSTAPCSGSGPTRRSCSPCSAGRCGREECSKRSSRRPGDAVPARSPASSARRWSRPAATSKAPIPQRSRRRCGRRGCSIAGSAPKAPIRPRWPRSSASPSRRPAARS